MLYQGDVQPEFPQISTENRLFIEFVKNFWYKYGKIAKYLFVQLLLKQEYN